MRHGAIRKAILLSCIGAVLGIPAHTLDGQQQNAMAHGPCPSPPVLAASGTRIPIRAGAHQTAPRDAEATRQTVPKANKPPTARAGTGVDATPLGMVAAIDPETAELGLPSPEQMRSLMAGKAEILRISPNGIVEVRRPDGAVGLELNGNLQSFSVARIGPDGRIAQTCVSSLSEAKAAAEAAIPMEEDR